MRVVRHPVVDTRMQPLVLIPVEIVGDTAWGISRASKIRPLADFKDFGFKT